MSHSTTETLVGEASTRLSISSHRDHEKVSTSTGPSTTHLEIPRAKEQNLERHLPIPGPALERLQKAGIDLSNGYPDYPRRLTWLEDAWELEPKDREYVDPGTRADPDKKALFGAAKEVRHLAKHLGTEIVGLQLKVYSPHFKLLRFVAWY